MVVHLTTMQQSRIHIWLLPGLKQALSIPGWVATWDGTVLWPGLKGMAELHKICQALKNTV
jgi:hypothetical protein